jgi:hypothetical protein
MAEIIDANSRMQKSSKYGQRFVVEVTTESLKWRCVCRLYDEQPAHVTLTALSWGKIIKMTSGRLTEKKSTDELVQYAKDAVERLEEEVAEDGY